MSREKLTGMSGAQWSYWMQKMGASRVSVTEDIETQGFRVLMFSEMFDEVEDAPLADAPRYEVDFHHRDHGEEDFVTVRRLDD